MRCHSGVRVAPRAFARARFLAAAVIAVATLLAAWSRPAVADDAFWRNLSAKYGDSRPVVGLLDQCIDLVTYTGEVQFSDVTQQSGLSANKSASTFTGSRFTVDSEYHWTCAVFDGKSEEAAAISTVRIPFHSDRSITGLDARIIMRDGTPASVPKAKIRDEARFPEFPDYADLRWRVVDFGPLPDTCIIDLKYSIRGSEAFASNTFAFDHPYPVDQVLYTITTPISVIGSFPWWTDSYMRHGDLESPETESVTGSTGEMQRYIWEAKNVPEMAADEFAPPAFALARSVDLTVAFERDWDKLRGWYYEKVEAVFANDQRATELALAIVRGIDADSLKARALYEHVRRNVRWVPIPVNESRLIPDPPSEVLERGYGDAKDASACLAHLMRCVGLDASLSLVSSRSLGRFEQNFPTFQFFDHAVVHSFLPDREVWLDVTDPALGFGEVSERLRGPGNDAGLTPLIVWDGSPNFWEPAVNALAIEPYGPSDCGYDLTDAVTTWDASGSLRFEATADFHGAHSLILRREMLGKSPDEQRTAFERWLNSGGGDNTVVGCTVRNLDSLGTDLSVRFAVSRPWTPGADEVRVPTRFFGLPALNQTPSGAKRSGSLVFLYPEAIQHDVTITPPEGYVVSSFPGDTKVSSGFLDFQRDYDEMFDGLGIRTYLTLKDFDIDKAVYGRFLRGLEEIQRAGAEEIVFTKAQLVGQAGN